MAKLEPHPLQTSSLIFVALAVVMTFGAVFLHFSAFPHHTVTFVLLTGAFISTICGWLHFHLDI